MPTYNPVQAVQGSLVSDAVTVYYTAPVNTKLRVGQCTLTNTDTNARVVTVYLAQGSGVPGDADKVQTVTLAPSATYSVYTLIGDVVRAGNSIQAVCDVDAVVTLKVAGVEIT